jgi:hypothetical protein
LTKSQAEAALRRLIEVESNRPPPTPDERPRTVDDVIDLLRDRLEVQGARLSYRQNWESMQRVHVSPAIGARRVDSVSRQDIERLARSMLGRAYFFCTLTGAGAFAQRPEPFASGAGR